MILLYLALLTSYIIILILLKIKPHLFLRISTFTMVLCLHMVFLTFGFLTETPRLNLLLALVVVSLSALCLQIGRDFKNYRAILMRLVCYHGAVIALIIGSLVVTPLLPAILTLPFQLLIQLAMVFLTAWQFYLYMTYTLLHTPPAVDEATIIVLGAGIYTEAVTPMLQARLDRAIALSRTLKKYHIIVSGGQGVDEPISEALAMQRYLLTQNIPLQHITMEDQSTNTRENLLYSKPLLANQHAPVVIVTSAFHLMRALRIAQRQQLRPRGYGAPTPHHWVGRELIRDYSGLLFQYPQLWIGFSMIQLIISALKIL